MSVRKKEIETKINNQKVIVLLIDDEPRYAEQIRNIIAAEKEFAFHYCQDPVIATKMIEKNRPSVLLIDHFMPKMDSFRLIHSIKENKETVNLPIIFLLTRTDDSLKAKALESGASEVVIKIPERNVFVNKIRNYSDEYYNLLTKQSKRK